MFIRGENPIRSSLRNGENHLPYRADIDGLRAIAILPVVLFHAGVPGLGGGFVGVDVFFVISGYLMCSLITGEMALGKFSLAGFYQRRIRRIFPALFAMMLTCAVVAWFAFMPQELLYFARSMTAASLFASNIQFAKEAGYFDIGAQMKPLLHTWSLAVEEQFYIGFPLLMVLLQRLTPRQIMPVMLVALAASFAASIGVLNQNSTAGFYLSQYRVWELLIGVILGLGAIPELRSETGRQVLAAIGLVLIGIAVFVFTEKTAFPGFAALLPCLGAACIIHARAGNGIVGRLLALRPMVFVGLISYSLYLWHWPIIVFTRYFTDHELTPALRLVVILASLVVAVASWHFVERPFRKGRVLLTGRLLPAMAVLLVGVTAGAGALVVMSGGAPGRLPADVRAIYAATYDRSHFYQAGCFSESDHKGPSDADVESGRVCALGDLSDLGPDFLVWGDSHAAAMAPAIDAAAAAGGFGGMFAAHASCPPLNDVPLATKGDTRRCAAFNDSVRDLIREKHIPLVFMLAYWPKYVHQSELPNQGDYFDASIPPNLADYSKPVATALDNTLAQLKQEGVKVVLVMDVPEMGHFVPEALAKAKLEGTSPDIAPPLSYIAERQALARSVLEKSAAEYDAMIVDPLPSFCDNARCHASRAGVPLYMDADHITASAAKSLGYLFASVFKVAQNI